MPSTMIKKKKDPWTLINHMGWASFGSREQMDEGTEYWKYFPKQGVPGRGFKSSFQAKISAGSESC